MRQNRGTRRLLGAVVGLVLLLLLGSAGWAYYYTTRPTPIADVLNRASDLDGQEVRIRGRVIEGGDFLGLGMYLIEDASGRVWITTQNGSPAVGREVTVEGHVRKLMQFPVALQRMTGIPLSQVTGLQEIRRQ